MKSYLLAALLVWGLSGIVSARADGAWSSQDYDFYGGDFNGDGRTDLLYVAKAPNRASGVLLSDGTSPSISAQSWTSDYLGIPWAGNAYKIVVADFNGDGKADIFLQSTSGGDNYLLITDISGQITAISQTVAAGAMGLDWSPASHEIHAGDFTGDGKADLFLQSTFSNGVDAVVSADSNGQFTAETPKQIWTDGFLGFDWSTEKVVVSVGDFNGDGRADLLIQAYPGDVDNSSPTYAPNMDGIAFGRPGAEPFSLASTQSWTRNAFGVEWSPLVYNPIVADFNGDGCADVLMQPLNTNQNAYLLTGQQSGPVFAQVKAALPSNTIIAVADAHLIAGKFGASPRAALFIQTTSTKGINFLASNVLNGIHANAISTALGDSNLSSGSSEPASIATNSSSANSMGNSMVIAAAVTAPATLPNTSAGRTAAQFSVSPAGGATYNIPLWTPPGVRNIEPHLALRYSAGGPDGMMGPGWALSGLSGISRCGKTWASSGGSPSGITTTTSDDFCLDGNRLRLVTGYTPYCTGGTTYMTEIADFSLITACGTAGSGPAYFVVQGKDSHYYEYGNTATSANSLVYATGAATPYVWALDKVSDRQGNTLLITYNAGSVTNPAAIKYTAIASAPTIYHYSVNFTYAARTGGTTLTKFVAGFPVTQSQQLSKVNVISDWPSANTSVRQYYLNYGSSGTTNRPLLASVQECGGTAGTDCLRPTTINYQTGAAGWSTTPISTGLTGQYGFVPIDLNGDGIPDALYGSVSGNNLHWYAKIGTLTGYGPQIDTGANTGAGQTLVPGAFSGKPGQQFLAPVGTTWYAYSFNGTGFVSSSTGVAVTDGLAILAIDYDGDGLSDFVSPDAGLANLTVRRNTSPGTGAIAFASTALIVYSASNTTPLGSTTPADFNGDGKADLMITIASRAPRDLMLISNGFSAPPTAVTLTGYRMLLGRYFAGDLNGDGCTDLFGVMKLRTDGSGYDTLVGLSDCSGGFNWVPTSAPGTATTVMAAVDWDGDGQTDLAYVDQTTNTWFVQRSLGNSLAAATNTGISAPTTKTYITVDRNSDGQPDLMYVDSANGYAVSYLAHAGANTPPDLGTSITDGFGINFSPTYVPISQSNYTKYTDASFPDVDFQGPMYVVNQFSASSGTGGTYTNTLTYYGAHLSLQGRGFEGFYAARQIDSRNSVAQYTYYRRDFPYIGSVSETDTYQPDLTTRMARSVSTYAYQNLAGTNCSLRCFPHVSTLTDYRYEITGAKKGLSTSNTNTTYTYSTDGYGNLVNTVAKITDTDAAAGTEAASPFNGQSWTTTIANTPANNATTWCLGRPSSTTTVKTAPGQPSLTRTVTHTVDTTACRATVETIEPGTALQVQNTFGFDACGNTNAVSVVGKDQNGVDLPARLTSTSFGARCQFQESVSRPLTPAATTAYRYDLGVSSSSTDPNGIVISWTYDNFARKTRENRPDGTYSISVYNDCVAASCWGSADLRLLAYQYEYNSAGSQLRVREKFYDGMDRLRFDETYRALGIWTVSVTKFDSLGRKSQQNIPYASTANGYHIYSYDLANRLTSDTLYTGSGSIYRTIGVTYSGQTITVTDPNGAPNTKVTDVAGNLRWVTDPTIGGTVAGTTKYTYDAFNNLVTVVDAGSHSSTYTYNIRGFKTAAADADTGGWTFVPNSLNELVSQTDAKGQTTTFGYDLLGRMNSRLEPESATATTWVYGTNAPAHEIGRLKTVTKPDGYSESYLYDSIGRPQTVTYTEDAVSYPFDYAYNNIGTVDTLTYPTSTSGVRFVLKTVYDAYGYLNQVKDNTAGTVFWTLQSNNDSNLPTGELLGNGVTVTTGYTPYTNEMVTRQEGSGGSTTNLQNLSYSWDLNGNLGQRQDIRQSLTEIFTLDALNRIKTATLNGTQTLSMAYDATGNITNKSDVSASNYVYANVAHPHAVTAAGTWTLVYDANGNMTSRAGSTITWYSYNLPNQINYGSSSTQFSYDASHQRWKQIANYGGTVETSHYVGGLLEILNKGTVTEYRHQIPGGSATVVYTRRSDGTNSVYYATSDHLGSADLVMDSTGAVLTRESFTPFGARRGSNWQGIPTTADYAAFDNTTRRGFTGHEMLDSVSLVHMNGRVYDPYLARFIAADNVIQSLGVAQSVNPYSYAWNDPLRYTDPSGHDTLLDDLLNLVPYIGAAILAIGFGYGASLFFGGGLLGAVAGGFVGGFVGAAVLTGNLSAALTGGLIGAITGGLFYEVGSLADAGNWDTGGRVLAHAAVGCTTSMLSGGNCGKGALAAGLSEMAVQEKWVQNTGGEWGTFKATAEAGLVGGSVNRILGGDFVEGFSTAAAGYLFNEDNHRRLKIGKAIHDAAVAQAEVDLTEAGYIVQGTEVYSINSVVGTSRYYDIVALDPSGAEVGFEVKTSAIGSLRTVSSQMEFDTATAGFPGTTSSYLSTGPVLIQKVGYLGYYPAGAVAAQWQSGALQAALNGLGAALHVAPPKVVEFPIP